ncbi:MAG: DUF2721 domain-containing protein [Planctomycetaceae bacterium]|nr:DUF2721 domain-containing protein [Planctomycetaceae bacterium]
MEHANPFAVLSLIVAPAILTNAASVLTMSTSNRLARAVDRARELSKQLEADSTGPETERRLSDLAATEERSLLLLRALRGYYFALGGFASAALVSLLGAVLAPFETQFLVWVLEILGVAAGLAAVGAIVHGSALLVRETQIAVQLLSERATRVREQMPR